MKVLLLADEMESGGAETHVATLARGLMRAGHTVGLCSYGGGIAEALEKEGVFCRTLPKIGRDPFAFLAAKRILAEEICKNGYEILHSHTRMAAFLSHKICNPYMRKSSFFSLGGATCPCNPYMRKSQKMPARTVTVHARFRSKGLYRLLSDWGEHTIAVSEDLRAYVADVYGLPAACVTVIPNGIDEERYFPPAVKRDLAGNAPVGVLFVSRLEPDCSLGAVLLCRSAARLAREEGVPPFSVTLAGRGSAAPALAALAGRSNLLAGRNLLRVVRPRGERELIDLYRAASIFVGVSRAAMEASFCGCAVLLCGNEGYGGLLSPDRPDLAAGNFCCRGLPPPDENSLVRDLAVLLKNPDLRAANARKTGAWMRKNFAAKAVCRATEEVYRRLLWQKGKGDYPIE